MVTNGLQKAAERAVFVSLLQACNNQFCVCSLLQEKGKADGNIDQCEYTYCVQTKQHFSKYAMLCSITKSFLSSSSVILTYTLVF